MSEITASYEFQDDDLPSLGEMLEYYKDAKDGYLSSLEKFWKLPIQKHFEQADSSKDELKIYVGLLLSNCTREVKDEQSEVAQALTVTSLGDMCDEEITKGINDLLGEKGTFGNIRFQRDEEIDVDEESIEYFKQLYTEIIVNKIESDFEDFCRQPRFQRFLELKSAGSELLYFSKIAVAAAVGTIVVEKLRKRK